MLRVIFADDQEEMHEIMEGMLEGIPFVSLVGSARNGIDLIEEYLKHGADVLIVDVEMPLMDGLEACRKIREKDSMIPIIIATAFEDFTSKAFSLYATDYIKKPYSAKRLRETLERVKAQIESSKYEERISIESKGEKAVLRKSDIYFVEANQKKSFIHTGVGVFETKLSLGEIGELLGKGFVRSHKSFVINYSKIIKISQYTRTSREVLFRDYEGKALLSLGMLEEVSRLCGGKA